MFLYSFLGVTDCYMFGNAEINTKLKIESPHSSQSENVTTTSQSENTTSNQTFSTLNFSDLDSSLFLELYNNSEQTVCPVTYVNPKELVQNVGTSSKSSESPEPKPTLKKEDIDEKQDQPLTNEDSQNVVKDILQNADIPNPEFIAKPPEISVDPTPEIKPCNPQPQNNVTGNLWQHFGNSNSKVVVVPVHQNQMSANCNARMYSVAHTDSSKISPKPGKKQERKRVVQDDTAPYPPPRTSCRRPVPTSFKEKPKKRSQISSTNKEKINMSDLKALRKPRNYRMYKLHF